MCSTACVTSGPTDQPAGAVNARSGNGDVCHSVKKTLINVSNRKFSGEYVPRGVNPLEGNYFKSPSFKVDRGRAFL